MSADTTNSPTSPVEVDSAINLAAVIATEAHRGQQDKAGAAYISHPQRVAERLQREGAAETTVAAGWLHDVVEDTDLELGDLIRHGLPAETVRVVGLLTKRPGREYQDYLSDIAADPAARAVKLADLADNSDPVRLSQLPESTQERLQAKYAQARSILAQ